MAYVALYRTYRPKTFTEVAGQSVIIQTLQNSIMHDKIGHAYLFSGPRGTGKTSIAKIFAKTVNCLNPNEGNPCNTCDVCKGIDKGDIADVIEIDAASNNGVDEIREIRDKVKYMPSVGKYKVYIIDEVHMLTTGAFNALLKTLEEPPKHIIFILATTEAHKIPATILSRCLRFDFKNLDVEEIYEKLTEVALKENIEIEDEAKKLIALNAEGGMRDALSLFDQVISYVGTNIKADDVHEVSGSVSKKHVTEILESLDKKMIQKAITTLNQLVQSGKEASRIVIDLIYALRDILLDKKLNQSELKYPTLNHLSVSKIYFYIDILSKLQNEIKFTHQKRIYIELAFVKMVDHRELKQIDYDMAIENLQAEIIELKNLVANQPKNVSVKTVNKEKALVTSKDIENILNNADKEKRNLLQGGWKVLKDYPKEELKLAGYLLSEGELVAVSKDILVVYDDFTLCEQLMHPEIRKQALKIFNNKNKIVRQIYAIGKSDWLHIKNIYLSLYKQGQDKPKLPEHDYRLYEKEIEEKEEISPILKLSYEYFGDKVKIEE